jgi:acetylglutamate kinase
VSATRLIVVKVGGEIFKGDEVHAVAADVAAAQRRGHQVVVVHGGGPQATDLQQRLGQTPQVVAGRRITDPATLEVMKMVVAGQLNVDLCAVLLGAGARPVGLHGASSLAVAARKRPPRLVSGGGDAPIDFGLVGDVTGCNTELLTLLLGAGYTPVISCLGATPEGLVLNINADIIANQAARLLDADHLVLVTGAPGVLRDVNDPASRIAVLDADGARAAIDDGTVSGGMIPKLEESLGLLEASKIDAVHIVGKIGPGDLLREIDEPGSVGTALVRSRT